MTRDVRLDELNGRLESLMAIEPGEEGAIHELNDIGPRYSTLNEDGAASRELELKVNELQGYLARVNGERETAVNYFTREMSKNVDLVDALADKKLAKSYYNVGPHSIEGDEEHNKRAVRHAKAMEAENQVRDKSTKFEDLAALAYRGLLKEAEDYVKDKYSEENEPDISKDTRKRLMATLPVLRAERNLSDLKRDKATLKEYARIGAKELKKEFEKSFANDEERRDYTAANLRQAYSEAEGMKGDARLAYLAQVAKSIREVDKTKV